MYASRVRLLAILAAALLCVSSCATQVATPEPVYLQIAGSSAMVPLLKALATAYTERHPEVTIDIQGGGTLAGLQSLREGSFDLAAASWKDEEPARGEPVAGQVDTSQLAWHAIGRDGLAVIVHPNNTLGELNLEETGNLFAGWYVSWDEVDGRGAEIQVISREEGSGSRMAFESMVMGNRMVTQTAVVMPSSQSVIEWVSANSNAVGYVSMALITDSVQSVPLNGVDLDNLTVRGNSYPLIRKLYLVVREPAKRSSQDFIDFCRSPAGQAIVNEYHAPAN